MSSREHILGKLRGGKRPFPTATPIKSHIPMTPISDDADTLLARFIQEATAVDVTIHQAKNETAAIEQILQLIGSDAEVMIWEPAHMPLPRLTQSLADAQIGVADSDNADVRVGITGATAALAATGSLLLESGNGRFRTTSLLPSIHIAVIRQNQILPNFESWVQQQEENGRQAFQAASNIIIITGPSRTADIGMELILGMHGPSELHLIILDIA
jgi:L-lactate dehydrogenase complex protein LldG